MGRDQTRRTRRWVVTGASAMVAVLVSTSPPGAEPPPSVSRRSGVVVGRPLPALLTARAADDLDPRLRERLVDEAERALEIEVRPRDPLRITDTDDPFVRDARAAWTLALAGRVTGERRYREAAGEIVDAWATVSATAGTCASSGGDDCSTSLMISRAAPALVFAVGMLRADGSYGGRRLEHFHRWLRAVVLPAASDRSNNWGDAGTFLRAAVAAELEDPEELDEAVRLWRGRMDLMEADGRIPEEMRRGDASLMYAQEALAYRVMSAEIFAWAGVDVWSYRGRRGGTLRVGLELVARGLEDPERWPGGADELRVPDPNPIWAVVARRWPTDRFEAQADRARAHEGGGHSAVVWLAVTHGG